MIHKVNRGIHDWAIDRPQFSNAGTIKTDSWGRYAGDITEFFFSKMLAAHSMHHMCVGKDVYEYDFDVGGFTIDTKAKERTYCYKERPDRLQYDEAHICLNQQKFDCHIYVFSSVHKPKGSGMAETVEFMGWIKKDDFWKNCRLVREGETDGKFTERRDAGKMLYSDTKPMAELFDMLSDLRTVRRFG